jgi:hypothetical protein
MYLAYSRNYAKNIQRGFSCPRVTVAQNLEVFKAEADFDSDCIHGDDKHGRFQRQKWLMWSV